MKKTRTKEMSSEENLPSDLTVSSNTVKSKLEVKAKIELTPLEEKVIYWFNKGQSVDWISKALMLHANKVKEIIDNANV